MKYREIDRRVLLREMFILLGVYLALSSAFTAPRWLSDAGEAALGFHNGATCDFSRGDALVCISQHVDTNSDGVISMREFDRAKTRFAPLQLRAAEWVLNRMGYFISERDVMRGCDVNKDGKLTLWDWQHGQKTCLPKQADLCKLKTICDRANQ